MRRYLCREIVYTDSEIAKMFNKTVQEVNDRYDSGGTICIDNIPIILTKITEKQLMWIVGGSGGNQMSDGSIYCPIGIPIDINAYEQIMSKDK